MDQPKVILVTGSGSGFGRLTVETLARQGHQVYATMRDIDNRNARPSGELRKLAPVQEQINTGMQEMFSGDSPPNPQDVADAIAGLIATPAGQRPLRTLVGQDAQAATHLNQVAQETQAQMLEQLGMASLMIVSPPERLAA